MELFDGRPENTEGRLPREVRTYDFLDESAQINSARLSFADPEDMLKYRKIIKGEKKEISFKIIGYGSRKE